VHSRLNIPFVFRPATHFEELDAVNNPEDKTAGKRKPSLRIESDEKRAGKPARRFRWQPAPRCAFGHGLFDARFA
jgi:hypothetical protein